MTESDSSSAATATPSPAATAEPSATTNTTSSSPALPAVEEASSWKLPVGIEDHLEAGVLKAAVGMTLGGLTGMLLFRGGSKGSGWRSASIATGLGVAVGSTYERAAATTRAASHLSSSSTNNNNSPPAADGKE